MIPRRVVVICSCSIVGSLGVYLHFLDRSWIVSTTIEVCDRRRNVSVYICLHSSGKIEVLGDVYFAAGRVGGRALNVASHNLPFDAESKIDARMSISGGYRSKKEYGSNERLGEHLVKTIGNGMRTCRANQVSRKRSRRER